MQSFYNSNFQFLKVVKHVVQTFASLTFQAISFLQSYFSFHIFSITIHIFHDFFYVVNFQSADPHGMLWAKKRSHAGVTLGWDFFPLSCRLKFKNPGTSFSCLMLERGSRNEHAPLFLPCTDAVHCPAQDDEEIDVAEEDPGPAKTVCPHPPNLPDSFRR